MLSAFLREYKTPHPPGSVQDHKRKMQRSARLFSLADGRSLQNRKDQNPHSDKPPPGHPPEASLPLRWPFQSPGIRNAPPAASPSHIPPQKHLRLLGGIQCCLIRNQLHHPLIQHVLQRIVNRRACNCDFFCQLIGRHGLRTDQCHINLCFQP